MTRRSSAIMLVGMSIATCPTCQSQPSRPSKTMTNALPDTSPLARYRAYLAELGWADRPDRAFEVVALALPELHCFAYDAARPRFRLAVTKAGRVRPGAHPEDDWAGLLGAGADAGALAARLAWLQGEAAGADALNSVEVSVLAPGAAPVPMLDPLDWALVEAPSLQLTAAGEHMLSAWLWNPQARQPARWMIHARVGEPAKIERLTAAELRANRNGRESAGAKLERARASLRTGSLEAQLWALQLVRDNADHSAVREIAGLLARPDSSRALRLTAVGTLAALADPNGVPALAALLRRDSDAGVRRAAADALSRTRTEHAIRALSESAQAEADNAVRVAIVHALMAQGAPARATLEQLAQHDPDERVRQLARDYAERLRAPNRP